MQCNDGSGPGIARTRCEYIVAPGYRYLVWHQVQEYCVEPWCTRVQVYLTGAGAESRANQGSSLSCKGQIFVRRFLPGRSMLSSRSSASRIRSSARCLAFMTRSEEHTSELQSRGRLVCRL